MSFLNVCRRAPEHVLLKVLVLLLRMRQVCNHPALIIDPDATAENSGTAGGSSVDAISEYDRAIKVLGAEWVRNTVAKVEELAVEKMEAELQVNINFFAGSGRTTHY